MLANYATFLDRLNKISRLDQLGDDVFIINFVMGDGKNYHSLFYSLHNYVLSMYCTYVCRRFATYGGICTSIYQLVTHMIGFNTFVLQLWQLMCVHDSSLVGGGHVGGGVFKEKEKKKRKFKSPFLHTSQQERNLNPASMYQLLKAQTGREGGGKVRVVVVKERGGRGAVLFLLFFIF